MTERQVLEMLQDLLKGCSYSESGSEHCLVEWDELYDNIQKRMRFLVDENLKEMIDTLDKIPIGWDQRNKDQLIKILRAMSE